MKKFSLALIGILTLFSLAVGGYLYFLDTVNKTKTIQHEIAALKQMKNSIQKPMILPPTPQLLRLKVDEYTDIARKLELHSVNIKIEKNILSIQGPITDTYAYMMVKRILNIIKNDDVTLESVCLGKGCTEYEYGFSIKITPFVLSYR